MDFFSLLGDLTADRSKSEKDEHAIRSINTGTAPCNGGEDRNIRGTAGSAAGESETGRADRAESGTGARSYFCGG